MLLVSGSKLKPTKDDCSNSDPEDSTASSSSSSKISKRTINKLKPLTPEKCRRAGGVTSATLSMPSMAFDCCDGGDLHPNNNNNNNNHNTNDDDDDCSNNNNDDDDENNLGGRHLHHNKSSGRAASNKSVKVLQALSTGGGGKLQHQMTSVVTAEATAAVPKGIVVMAEIKLSPSKGHAISCAEIQLSTTPVPLKHVDNPSTVDNKIVGFDQG